MIRQCPRGRRAAAALLFLGGGGSSIAAAQAPPSVGTRVVASHGSGSYVAETHLAASRDHVFVVFRKGDTGDAAGFAVYDKRAGTWADGSLPYKGSIDAAVVHDAHNDRFVVVQFAGGKAPITWWSRAAGLQKKGPAIDTPANSVIDKPWIVVGQNDAFRQELYVTAIFKIPPGGLSLYARSLDGGETWFQGDVGVASTFAIEPAVATTSPSTPLYLVWTKPGSQHRYEFLRGDDDGLRVDFAPLANAGAPIGVDLHRACADCGGIAPGPFPVKLPPHLAADPTDPDRLFLVYCDVAAPGSQDLDVFCVRLERSGAVWRVGPRVRVNDDRNPDGGDNDQLTPDLAVDAAGRVHVVFYDDRAYAQDDATLDARYDVTYAYSTDGGRSFVNVELAAPPGEEQPALDFSLTVNDQVPLEYPGITTFGDEVWIAFAGTHDADPTPDKSVIYVSRVLFGG